MIQLHVIGGHHDVLLPGSQLEHDQLTECIGRSVPRVGDEAAIRRPAGRRGVPSSGDWLGEQALLVAAIDARDQQVHEPDLWTVRPCERQASAVWRERDVGIDILQYQLTGPAQHRCAIQVIYGARLPITHARVDVVTVWRERHTAVGSLYRLADLSVAARSDVAQPQT